jgi:hypothetical protein
VGEVCERGPERRVVVDLAQDRQRVVVKNALRVEPGRVGAGRVRCHLLHRLKLHIDRLQRRGEARRDRCAVDGRAVGHRSRDVLLDLGDVGFVLGEVGLIESADGVLHGVVEEQASLREIVRGGG